MNSKTLHKAFQIMLDDDHDDDAGCERFVMEEDKLVPSVDLTSIYKSYFQVAQMSLSSSYQMWMGFPKEDFAIMLDISRDGTRKRIENLIKDSEKVENDLLSWKEIVSETGGQIRFVFLLNTKKEQPKNSSKEFVIIHHVSADQHAKQTANLCSYKVVSKQPTQERKSTNPMNTQKICLFSSPLNISSKLKKKKAKIALLKEKISQLTLSLESTRTSASVNTSIAMMEQEDIEIEEIDKEQIRQLEDKYLAEIINLEQEISNFQYESEANKMEMNALEKKLEEVGTLRMQLDAANLALAHEKSKTKQSAELLALKQGECNEVYKELEQAKTVLQLAQNEIVQTLKLREQLDSANQIIEQKKCEVQQLQRAIQDANAIVAKCSMEIEQISSLRMQLQNANQKDKDLKDLRTNLEMEFKEIEFQKKEFDLLRRSQNQSLLEKELKIQQLQLNIQQSMEIREELKNAAMEIVQLKTRNQDLNETIDKIVKQNQDLGEQCVNYTIALNEANRENSELQTKKEYFMTKLNEKRTIYKQYLISVKKQNGVLEEAVKSKEKIVFHLQQVIINLQAELAHVKPNPYGQYAEQQQSDLSQCSMLQSNASSFAQLKQSTNKKLSSTKESPPPVQPSTLSSDNVLLKMSYNSLKESTKKLQNSFDEFSLAAPPMTGQFCNYRENSMAERAQVSLSLFQLPQNCLPAAPATSAQSKSRNASVSQKSQNSYYPRTPIKEQNWQLEDDEQINIYESHEEPRDCYANFHQFQVDTQSLTIPSQSRNPQQQTRVSPSQEEVMQQQRDFIEEHIHTPRQDKTNDLQNLFTWSQQIIESTTGSPTKNAIATPPTAYESDCPSTRVCSDSETSAAAAMTMQRRPAFSRVYSNSAKKPNIIESRRHFMVEEAQQKSNLKFTKSIEKMKSSLPTMKFSKLIPSYKK